MSELHQNKVSLPVIKRLPKYYRYLSEMHQNGVVKVSSSELARMMGTTASQVRQDFNCFGGFGQQGYGYNVAELRGRIGAILGLTHKYRCIVVGAGNIGLAVSGYAAFRQIGFVVEALFDVRPQALGYTKGGLPVLSVEQLPQYLAENPIDVGVLAVPEGAAQPMCDLLVKGGVKAIWNFAPVDLSVPEGVTLNSVHLQDTLLVLSYYMTNPAKADERSE